MNTQPSSCFFGWPLPLVSGSSQIRFDRGSRWFGRSLGEQRRCRACSAGCSGSPSSRARPPRWPLWTSSTRWMNLSDDILARVGLGLSGVEFMSYCLLLWLSLYRGCSVDLQILSIWMCTRFVVVFCSWNLNESLGDLNLSLIPLSIPNSVLSSDWTLRVGEAKIFCDCKGCC